MPQIWPIFSLQENMQGAPESNFDWRKCVILKPLHAFHFPPRISNACTVLLWRAIWCIDKGMASSDITDYHKKEENSGRCLLCMQEPAYMIDPRQLPCGDIVCLPCYEEKSLGTRFKCPACRYCISVWQHTPDAHLKLGNGTTCWLDYICLDSIKCKRKRLFLTWSAWSYSW